MTFRIAVVQPISHPPGDAERNVGDALRSIERAAGEAADFVCFPETYPGPWRMPATFDPTAALAAAAAKHATHVVFGTIEPIRTGLGSIPAGDRGNSNTLLPTNFRFSTPCTAKSDLRCAAKSICRK